jgi:hypothetical protein
MDVAGGSSVERREEVAGGVGNRDRELRGSHGGTGVFARSCRTWRSMTARERLRGQRSWSIVPSGVLRRRTGGVIHARRGSADPLWHMAQVALS